MPPEPMPGTRPGRERPPGDPARPGHRPGRTPGRPASGPRLPHRAGRLPASIAIVALLAVAGSPVRGEEDVRPAAERAEGLLADERFEEALALTDTEGDDGPGWLGLRQRALAGLGRHDQALAAAERWVEACRTAADAPCEVQARQQAARALSDLGRHGDALDEADRCLELLLATAPGSDETELRVRLRRAHALSQIMRLADAEEELNRVEALWSASEAPDPRDGASIHGLRATLRMYALDPEGALPFREKARELALRSGSTQSLATATMNLGLAYLQQHRYAQAIGALEAALEIPSDPIRRSLATIHLGIAQHELGRWDEARRRFREGLELAREAGNRRIEGFALGELGITAWAGDRDAETALALFDEAIAIHEAIADWNNVAAWVDNQARIHRELGRWSEALDLYARKDAIDASISGRQVDPLVAKNRALCLRGLGRDDEAEGVLRGALALAEEQDREKARWQSHHELGRLLRDRGDAEGAREELLAAVEGIERLREGLELPALKADFLESKVEVYSDLVALEVAAGRPEAAFAVVERARARAFLDTLAESRARVRETLPAEVRTREEDLLRGISELQARIRRGDVDDPAAGGERLAALERELEAFRLRVRDEHPRFRSLRYPRPATSEELRAVLRPGEELLAIHLADDASYRFRVGPDTVDAAPLPGRARLEDLARQALADILAREEPGPAIAELAGLVLGSGALPERLLVVPDGLLHFLPFGILPEGHEPTIARREIATLPSASTLVELRRADPGSVRPRLLALGDAAYDGAESARLRSAAFAGAAALGRLPHTRREVEAIGELFGPEDRVLLLGVDATESRLKSEVRGGASVLHLAAHGWLDATSADASGLVLGPDPEDGEDGILQLREIVALPVDAELVTLSACHSALGELVTGEGLVGIARGFLHGGARTVLASLWNVDDAATTALMTVFYEELRAGRPKAAALRRAQLEVRSTAGWEHPFFWSGFVLIGESADGVAVPGRRGPGPAVAILLAVAALTAGGFLLLRRRRRTRPAG